MTHVSLHYSGFATFVDECSSVDIDSTDTMFITVLTTRMSGEYASELHVDCMKYLKPFLSTYFSLGVSISDLIPICIPGEPGNEANWKT